MSSTIYVGNLKWETTEESLSELFSPIGEVSSIKIITDRNTGRSRGFAFVTMENSEQAIQELNGKDFMGRPLKINQANDKPPRREPQGESVGSFQPRESHSSFPRDRAAQYSRDNSREWGQRRSRREEY
jgi:RNA recognition motif-containing protein